MCTIEVAAEAHVLLPNEMRFHLSGQPYLLCQNLVRQKIHEVREACCDLAARKLHGDGLILLLVERMA